jgi:hypothetical protein
MLRVGIRGLDPLKPKNRPTVVTIERKFHDIDKRHIK